VVDLLDLQPDDEVLEIGCGPGVAVEAAVAAGAQVVGVDPSEVMRAMAAKRNVAAIAEGRVDIRPGDSDHLPDGPFDAALAVNTSIFWPDADRTVAALADRMRPGGRVAIAVQPRWKGATDEDAVQMAEDNLGRLRQAGFTDLRVERLGLRPIDAACALGRSPA
jgi:SAM-dependent methyltransferase